MDNNEIKRYKFRRLPPSFWSLWKRQGEGEGKTKGQLIYGLITHMVMQRFKDVEINKMMYGWHQNHGIKVNHSDLVKAIAAVKDYTLEERRRIKREEMRKYRANKKAKKLVIELPLAA